MGRFDGKVAIVTGGGKGIGRAITERLAEEGASVAINYNKSGAEAEATVAAIEARGGQAMAMKADMTSAAELRAFFEAVDKRFGRLDMLINNAGVTVQSPANDGPLLNITEEQYDRIFDTNVKGVFLATQQAVRRMSAGASIVNIVSSSGDFFNANMTLYTASKFAPRAFTGVWAKEFGPHGIRVNAVSAGAIDVGMTERATAATLAWLKSQTPFNRLGRAEEIASVVAFLCSEDASWISGEVIRVNGAGST